MWQDLNNNKKNPIPNNCILLQWYHPVKRKLQLKTVEFEDEIKAKEMRGFLNRAVKPQPLQLKCDFQRRSCLWRGEQKIGESFFSCGGRNNPANKLRGEKAVKSVTNSQKRLENKGRLILFSFSLMDKVKDLIQSNCLVERKLKIFICVGDSCTFYLRDLKTNYIFPPSPLSTPK